MATAGTGTIVSTSDTLLYSSSDGCSEFIVAVLASSTKAAFVNIPGLHAAGEYITIGVGKEITFKLNKVGIKKVYAKGSGGSAVITYGVTGIIL